MAEYLTQLNVLYGGCTAAETARIKHSGGAR
jgi:hypothetical protein